MFQNSIGEESHLAMETSGHGALKENHWLDDGAYLMVITLFEQSMWKPHNHTGINLQRMLSYL
jgi:hypothetical protein